MDEKTPQQNASAYALATGNTSIFKKDLIISAIIGFFCAALALPIAQNLKIQQSFAFTLLVILPVLSVAGMAAAYWLAQKVKIFYQLAKFVLVGALNSLFDWGILNLLMFLAGISSGALYAVFKGISFLAAMTSSYFWNKFWTFKKKEASELQKSGQEMLQFFIVSVVGFALNVGGATLLVNVFGPQFGLSAKLWANVGALAGTVLSMGWNFVGYKLMVFKN
ncbi:MAG: GtrA family protein [Candidatus Portnoybacteria bacterium]|nr:GtrA family protein [Candidatus Portnoybacteria bacterium]MDD4982393.1 GtrA family protein [Candidatus Portnoybacteria bacterium]